MIIRNNSYRTKTNSDGKKYEFLDLYPSVILLFISNKKQMKIMINNKLGAVEFVKLNRQLSVD